MLYKNQENYYFLININKEIIYMNDNFCRGFYIFSGKKPRLFKSVVELVPQCVQSEVSEVLDRCFSHKPFTHIFTLILPDKISVTLKLKAEPVFYHGELTFVIIEIRDINAKDKYQDIAQKQKNALNDYAFFTSHVLREPVSHILSVSQVLNDFQIGTYDFLEITDLLTDLQAQAIKLDRIMLTLSSLLIDESSLESSPKELIKKNILTVALVDDDLLINKIHEYLIKKHFPHIQVKAYSNPFDALINIAETTPQLILLDINMPQIDGWKFLHQLDSEMISSEVVIVSSSIDPHEKMRAFRYERVKGFLNKPLTYEKIKKILT